MPVTCRKRGDVWRVVEASTGRITMNTGGTAVDGGGHPSDVACSRQAAAINAGKDDALRITESMKGWFDEHMGNDDGS